MRSGEGALKVEGLNQRHKHGEYERGGGVAAPVIGGGPEEPPMDFFKKIFVSEKTFQAILKSIFPYSITTILRKVRHSNTLFLSISFAFPCRPLCALVRFRWVCVWGGGGAQQLQCLSQPNFHKTAEPL